MHEATPRQKRASAALIAKVATPETFDEASRLIRDLRGERTAFPKLLATAAARAIAAMKFLMLRSKRVAIRRQSLRRQNMRSMMLRCL